MTHKSRSAPTKTSLMEEADADTTLVQEDAQRAGLTWYEGVKEQKKNDTTKVLKIKKKKRIIITDVSFRSQHAGVAPSESKAIWS